MNSLVSLIDMMLLKVVAGMTAELLPYRGTQSQEVSLYLDFIILVSQVGKKKNFWEHMVWWHRSTTPVLLKMHCRIYAASISI